MVGVGTGERSIAALAFTALAFAGLGHFGAGFICAALAFATLAFTGLFRRGQLVALGQRVCGKGGGCEVEAAGQCNSDQANTGFVRHTGHGDSPDTVCGQAAKVVR
ncbi:hypothetical protein D3C80_1615590 [compost metagenome]